LRAHPAAVVECAKHKDRLAARQLDSIEAYATAKTPFVCSALDRAERWAQQTGWRVA